ncbi:hypothetical protein SAMN05444411_1222 [Lutibacter oricola]|uniref:Tetratricopeptide repeat-containing protein n=1 Tax=Lutibacter oricola TaxID=762486 RepID=A0A1H3H2I8_9FLAO|nr:hypothetical protein [Lutibacter oricola]SDY08984.1 hypothetical protein SAMN05444411_1222 [Lutibacter oricola]
MGGEGSMQSMNTILRNNRNLLRKKGMFNREKSFRYLRNKYYGNDKDEFDIRKLSEKELLEIREKVIKDRKRENLRALIITILFLITLIVIGLYLFSPTKKITNQETNIYKSEKVKLENYKSYMNLGDKMILKQNWKYAIIQYEKATKECPEKYTGHYKLLLAYSYNCKNNNLDCEKTKTLAKELIEKFPQGEAQLGTILYNVKTQ